MDKRTALVVVAIDFGTTYSGYAFSYRQDYEKDHTQVFINNNWKSGDGLETSKTPTVILFDKNKSFCKFGYEAETKYNELLEDDEASGWWYFRRFKMKLFKEDTRRGIKISETLRVEDEQGRKMPALTVFSESIKYLKDHFLQSSENRGFKLQPQDVHFVLTVPAIWKDSAKQFMRMAAGKAGIPDKMLTLAYEPEAAAIYCKELTVQRKDGTKGSSLASFEPGQKFLVLDCGGGTVDVTSYAIQEDGRLRELYRPTGGPWGGTNVDKEYVAFLKQLIGEDIWRQYISENPEDFMDIQRKFELKKKSVHADSDDQTTIPFPNSLFSKYQMSNQCVTLDERIKTTRFSGLVQVKKDKLRFHHSLVKQFFKEPVDAIVHHLKHLLKKKSLRKRGIGPILMVGGFSDSSVLSEHVMEEFSKLTVICPRDAINAIMKGAVIFGHNQNLIAERISPRTYGISINTPFNDKIHPEKFKMFYDGKVMCTDIFHPIVKIGQSILVGQTVFKHTCLPTRAYDTTATVQFYETKSSCPMYTSDEDVFRLGELTVLIPDVSKGKNRPIEIEMTFGFTEIFVSAFERGTQNKAEATFNCLLN